MTVSTKRWGREYEEGKGKKEEEKPTFSLTLNVFLVVGIEMMYYHTVGNNTPVR